MLRRVKQVLRSALLLIGLLMLAWLPFTWHFRVWASIPLPGGQLLILVGNAAVHFQSQHFSWAPTGPTFNVDPVTPDQHPQPGALWPTYFEVSAYGITSKSVAGPLWGIACILLVWPILSFVMARRKRHQRGFPIEPKSGAIFIVLLDEPGLFVFPSAADAVRFIEPIDAETEIHAAFDSSGTPYRVEWVRPNRWGSFLVTPGKYRFVPAGPADPAALVRLLEAHPEHAQPPEAIAQLRSLLVKLRPTPESGVAQTPDSEWRCGD